MCSERAAISSLPATYLPRRRSSDASHADSFATRPPPVSCAPLTPLTDCSIYLTVTPPFVAGCTGRSPSSTFVRLAKLIGAAQTALLEHQRADHDEGAPQTAEEKVVGRMRRRSAGCIPTPSASSRCSAALCRKTRRTRSNTLSIVWCLMAPVCVLARWVFLFAKRGTGCQGGAHQDADRCSEVIEEAGHEARLCRNVDESLRISSRLAPFAALPLVSSRLRRRGRGIICQPEETCAST